MRHDSRSHPMDPSNIPSKHPGSVHSSDGIYVLRTTQQNQVQLSLMADQKANIIIGVSLIFTTITQAALLREDQYGEILILPLGILGLTMLCSFVTAVLCVSPRIRAIRLKKAEEMDNPLFFGQFTGVEEDEYVGYLLERLQDGGEAKELLIRDIHQTGKVLRRKFRLLRIAYLFLAVGIFLSGLSTLLVTLEL